MSTFSELLKQPLPSQKDQLVTESCDSEGCAREDSDDTVKAPETEELSTVEIADDEGDASAEDDAELSSDDFDPDDLSDEELADIDRELMSGDVADFVGDEEEVTLNPQEEMQADDMMATAATTMLVNDELSSDEKKDFIENGEAKIAVAEGFMTDSDVNELMLEAGLVTEAKYNNKMIIKLDAASKKKQLYALAINVSAAAHNDPDYRKYKKVMKMRKILRAKLQRKYHSEATKRMKIYFARLRKSKSPALNKIGTNKK